MKKNRILVKLISTSGSGHFYIKSKKKINKFKDIKKYDPKEKKHFIYKENKIK